MSVNVPRWLKIQEKVDFLLWELGCMLKTDQRLSAIERMIDESTGYDKEKMKIATRKMKQVKKLIKEYNEITK
jgi:hypothetical protein